MKRLLDIAAALFGLAAGSIVLLPAMLLVWLQDFHSPFYIAPRAGRGGKPFRMVKLRSMRVLADTAGGTSTAGDDPRITAIGRFVRRWKLDELTQLWNVLRGDMSLVGPRPQVMSDLPNWTLEERRLLSARPGITDLASIVFADEGDILHGAPDPDLRYQRVIRPWKSRLALLYVDAAPGVLADLRIVLLTVMNSLSRPTALRGVARLARSLGAGEELARVATREGDLQEAPPPGATRVFGTT